MVCYNFLYEDFKGGKCVLLRNKLEKIIVFLDIVEILVFNIEKYVFFDKISFLNNNNKVLRKVYYWV